MKKIALTLLRQILLSFGGAYLVGDAASGGTGVFNADQLQVVVGALMSIVGITWSFFDPDKVEALQPTKARLYGLFRHILTTLGGLSLSMGWLPEKTVELILSLSAVILGTILSIKAPEKGPLPPIASLFDNKRHHHMWFLPLLLLGIAVATVASSVLTSCSVTGGRVGDSIGREFDRATADGVTTTAVLHQRRNVWGAEFDFGGWAIGTGLWFVPNLDAAGQIVTSAFPKPDVPPGDPENMILDLTPPEK